VTSPDQPRLRLFAGPNGSGKSTVVEVLTRSQLGVYVNADDLERAWKRTGSYDLARYQLGEEQAKRWWPSLQASPLMNAARLQALEGAIKVEGTTLFVDPGKVNSYLPAATTDFIRQELLELRMTFTFESVMSHASKVELLRKAQASGYRTYLYFIATDDPAINVARVKQRVELDGHPVCEEKIRKRYYESIALLEDAVAATNRAYIFDNSGDRHVWLAEITDGEELTLHSDELPQWFTTSSLWQAFQGDAASS
jgi:predicted ABC-type ATPase